jgi:hypothetical protein
LIGLKFSWACPSSRKQSGSGRAIRYKYGNAHNQLASCFPLLSLTLKKNYPVRSKNNGTGPLLDFTENWQENLFYGYDFAIFDTKLKEGGKPSSVFCKHARP